MQNEARVYITETDVSSRLAELGLTQSMLDAILKHALQHALDCTDIDVQGAPGSMMYLFGNRAVRGRLAPLGWRKDQSQNYETTVHPDGTHAIAVTAGDRNTGLPDVTPSTKRDRGPVTRNAVETNQQISMFELLGEDAAVRFMRPLPAPRRHTWLLLHYLDRRNNMLRAELSIPLEMTSDGYVQKWEERIILGEIPFSPHPLEDWGGPDGPEYDIEIRRRTV